MKKSIIAASILFATSAFSAQAGNFLIGAAFTTGSGETEQTSISSTVNVDFDSSSTALKIGYVLENDNRFIFSYESSKQELKNNYTWFGKTEPELTGYNFDWQFTYPSNDFAPYWTIGLGSYSVNDSGSSFTDGTDLSGVSINYGVGFLYTAASNIEFDISYNGKSIGWEDYQSGYRTYSTDTSLTYLSIGLNFLF